MYSFEQNLKHSNRFLSRVTWFFLNFVHNKLRVGPHFSACILTCIISGESSTFQHEAGWPVASNLYTTLWACYPCAVVGAVIAPLQDGARPLPARVMITRRYYYVFCFPFIFVSKLSIVLLKYIFLFVLLEMKLFFTCWLRLKMGPVKNPKHFD